MQIWDTAGQEKYKSLAKIYYQNCQVAILVYDVTRKESFEEIKDFWYAQLKQNMKGKPLILAIVANKSDMINSEESDEARPKKFAIVNYNFSLYIIKGDRRYILIHISKGW